MKIMLVDDASFMRMTIKQIVEADGHKVVGEAATGAEALETYRVCKPDMVLMDITMPEVNGIEGVKLIKEYDKDATIIMVSAMGQQEMVVQAIQAGARSFIVKPFKPEKIIEIINNYKK